MSSCIQHCKTSRLSSLIYTQYTDFHRENYKLYLILEDSDKQIEPQTNNIENIDQEIENLIDCLKSDKSVHKE